MGAPGGIFSDTSGYGRQLPKVNNDTKTRKIARPAQGNNTTFSTDPIRIRVSKGDNVNVGPNRNTNNKPRGYAA